MPATVFSDPLAGVVARARELYGLATERHDESTRAKCLGLLVEIAKARKALGLASDIPLELAHEAGRA